MIDAGPSQHINYKCDPPYYHDDDCRCAEQEELDAEDFREDMLDRMERY